jgi:hypothetical protein
MGVALGKDWMAKFDMILANCNKPLFFKGDSPFFVINEDEYALYKG